MKSKPISAAALFLLLPPFAAFLFFTPRNIAFAGDNCVITSSDTESVNIAAAQGLMKELATRKALLTRTIVCAKADAQSLENDLGRLQINEDAAMLRTRLMGKLNDAINYYDIELAKVNDAGIAGTRGVAKEVLDWRASNYEPLAAQAANFTVWVQNQNLFNTAGNRLRAVENIVSLLEQTEPRGDIRNALASAQTLVRTASDKNQAAKNALLQMLPPDQSLTLITQSLQSLSDAYQKFFDISTIAQTVLSTNSK